MTPRPTLDRVVTALASPRAVRLFRRPESQLEAGSGRGLEAASGEERGTQRCGKATENQA